MQQDVGILHQEAAGHPLHIELFHGTGPGTALQQAHIFLGGDRLGRFRADLGGDDHFHELAIDDGLRGLAVQTLVEGDDAAEGGFRIGLIGAVIRLQQAGAVGDAAGVGVLDDDAGRAVVELLDAFEGGVGVGDVVVAEFLALDLLRAGDGPDRGVGLHIEGTVLVRILAIAAGLRALELQGEPLAEPLPLAGRVERGQVVADVAVVLCGMGEGLLRQFEAGGIAERACLGLHLVDQGRVVGGVGNDGDVFVVLGGGPDHGRAADVDVLDGVIQGMRLRYGGHEGIEVDADQVDVAHAVFVHGLDMRGEVAPRQDAGVDLGVQGLDPAVEHFRETGVVGDVDHRQAGLAEGFGGTAGGEEFDAGVGERAGEVDEAGFV